MQILIKAALLAAILGFLLVFVRGQHGVRIQAGKRLAFVAFLLLNAVAVMNPEATTWVAHLVGVGRCADLLLYGLIVTFVFAVISFYLRVREDERLAPDGRRLLRGGPADHGHEYVGVPLGPLAVGER